MVLDKMSILLHQEIVEHYQKGSIHISPFDPSQVGPNSYDVHLANQLKVYIPVEGEELVLDCKQKPLSKQIDIPECGLVLQPNVLYLGSTIEEIGSDWFIPMFEGVSSLARLGVYSHVSAGYGDIGFKSNWTTEIQVIHPTRIYPGMRIGQVYFHQVNQEANLEENRYQGKYVNQTVAQESKCYMDF